MVSGSIPWLRVFVEGVAFVGSILLPFATHAYNHLSMFPYMLSFTNPANG